MKIDGKELQTKREAKGKTTQDLATLIGKGRRRIQQLEQNGGNIGLQDAKAIAKYLGVKLGSIAGNQLTGGRSEPNESEEKVSVPTRL